MSAEATVADHATQSPVNLLWRPSDYSSRWALLTKLLGNQIRLDETFVRESKVFSQELVPDQLLPSDAEIIGWCEDAQGVIVGARHPLGSILIDAYPVAATITVSASNTQRLDALYDLVVGRVPTTSDSESISMAIWGSGDRSSIWRRREIQAPHWSNIRRNYPTAIRRQLDDLMTVERPSGGGRLIVWYGAPGTGKTNAIRSLARSWSHWCDTHVLADPEAFFGASAKLEEVLSTPAVIRQAPTIGTATIGGPSWRLVIAEDTDDLLRATSAGHGGGAMGRLFNLADGIIGQGTNSIFLITTNARVADLHPALLRPGRCMSRIEFEPHSASEAREWLPDELKGRVSGPLTLAELYELRGDHQRIEHHRKHAPRGYV